MSMITTPYIIYRWIISERQGDAANQLNKYIQKWYFSTRNKNEKFNKNISIKEFIAVTINFRQVFCSYIDIFIGLADYVQLKTTVIIPACISLYISIYIRLKFKNIFGQINQSTLIFYVIFSQISFSFFAHYTITLKF